MCKIVNDYYTINWQYKLHMIPTRQCNWLLDLGVHHAVQRIGGLRLKLLVVPRPCEVNPIHVMNLQQKQQMITPDDRSRLHQMRAPVAVVSDWLFNYAQTNTD